MSVYDYTVHGRKGEEVSFPPIRARCSDRQYSNSVRVHPEYTELEKLYEAYRAKGFEILDFPCNQFDGQAPESIEEIHEICKLKFGTQFPQFGKVEVNGEGAIPLYKHLKDKKGFAGFDMSHKIAPILDGILRKADPHYEKSSEIKWNFTKFLVDRNGNVVQRFEPSHDLGKVAKAIENLL
jgi:glutathione peroxidase